ncbi:hypothetical protein K432DRAFT_420604 [Lepidopterella palustris CBS 459.81]|uniref:Arylsulfotransferase n=1 Tax=Lepidopterella palustris CBS 459.81 TaxID=1314670 RepID=A0A8E2J8W7_9PEZI|nr:hypothetical protein K432DRAFT_420604 [Lepidopterella palustris CBS 459.81]
MQNTLRAIYKSRPDLSPLTLNITVSATSELSPGLILVAPYSGVSWDSPLTHGPLQPGPYIFTSGGELVWSGFGYVIGFVANFQAAKWKGEDVLFAFEASRITKHGHGHGHAKEVRGGNTALLDIHEFHVVGEKTTLVESYNPVPFDLKKYGAGPKSQWIVDALFQEIEIDTGRLLFQWNSLDHVHPDESVVSIASLKFGTGHNSSDALDYFHINSVDRDEEHNYLVSGRHTSTIYKINSTSGDIIWRLGGKNSDFALGSGVDFGFQHDARFISRSENGDIQTISFFDNSGPQLKGKTGEYINKSSGKLHSLNTKTWTATLVQEFPAPNHIFAFSQGGTQILPNGNAFVSLGSGGAVTEFSQMEPFNWTGIPHEKPAIVALAHGESTMVYVSGNGDTETIFWEFFWAVRIGQAFLPVVGQDGKVSQRTKTVRVKPYIYPRRAIMKPKSAKTYSNSKSVTSEQLFIQPGH